MGTANAINTEHTGRVGGPEPSGLVARAESSAHTESSGRTKGYAESSGHADGHAESSGCAESGTPAASDARSPLLAWVGAALALFLIGTAAPAGSVLRDYPLFAGQMWRCAVAAVVLLVVVAWTGWRVPNLVEAGWLAVLSVFGIGGFVVSLVAASRHADPAVVGSIVAATPVLLAVIPPLRARRWPRARIVVGCVFIAAGTALASGFGAVDRTGAFLCAAALACEVVFALCAVPVLPTLGALRTTAYAFVGAVPVLALAAIAFDGPRSLAVVPNREELLALAYLTGPVAVVANLCWYAGPKRLGAEQASLLYALTPVGAVVAAIVVAHELPGPRELVGIGVVTVGLLIGLRPRRRGSRSGVSGCCR